jgi:beta-phosphoglucomutase
MPRAAATDTHASRDRLRPDRSFVPAAVLFDFDGVIVHSEPLHLFAFQTVAAEEKIELSEEEYYRDLIGFDDKGAWRFVFEKRGRELDPKTFLRMMTRKSEVMREQIERRAYHALPGVEEFVRGLWRNVPLGICSGALREEIELMLEGVALRDCFSVITAAEDVDVGKPDPRGYALTAQRIAEKMGRKSLPPAQCLVIEDAVSVATRAQAAGFAVLGVATTYPQAAWPPGILTAPSLRPEDVKKLLPRLPILQ